MKVAVRLETQVTYNETHLVEVEVERVSSDSDIAFNSRVYDLAKEKYLEGESVRESQDPVENQGLLSEKWLVETPHMVQEFSDELAAHEWARLTREELKNAKD